VHRVGAASLDHLRRSTLLSRGDLEARLGARLAERCVLVGMHPLTLAEDTLRETGAVIAALERLQGAQLLFCFPNADAGSRELAERFRAVAEGRPDARLFVNLDPVTYWSLLRQASAMLGNSSSCPR
jgi:UDP-N-acetylglucosamine 2-epimerase (non-hydrolysing)/GDP/UDP-N,N'-diacetylbacillosamine 2-epimerase (hydrolysing)